MSVIAASNRNSQWHMLFSTYSKSGDPESQALTDGGDLKKFSVKERVSSYTEDITIHLNDVKSYK